MWILVRLECAASITSSQPLDSGLEIIQIIHVQKNKITTVSLTLSLSIVLLCRVPLGPNSHTYSTVDASLSLSLSLSNDHRFQVFLLFFLSRVQEKWRNYNLRRYGKQRGGRAFGWCARSRMAAENGDHVVELVVHDAPPSSSPPLSSEAEIIPLLNPVQKPKINIFTISYPRTKTRV